MTRRLAATTAAAAVLLAGCGHSTGTPTPTRAPLSSKSTTSGPRPLTEGEADRLAVSRFLAYQGTGLRFSTTVTTSSTPVRLVGDVDYRRDIGIATASAGGAVFVLQWTATALLTWPGRSAQAGTAPTTLPKGSPRSRALDPTASIVDAALALVLGLGQDRPDNPQLIQRNGAQWLRSTTLDGRRVDVVTGPTARQGAAGSGSALTYWIDARGNLLQVDARFGGSGGVTDIALDAAGFAAVPALPH